MSTRRERSAAEWTTFAISCAVVLALVAAIALQAMGSDKPPMPIAVIDGAIERRGAQFHVPVTVTNSGDETAEAVQVLVSSTLDGETTEAEQIVDFLAGSDEQDLVFVFDEDPRRGELTVRVAGFTVP